MGEISFINTLGTVSSSKDRVFLGSHCPWKCCGTSWWNEVVIKTPWYFSIPPQEDSCFTSLDSAKTSPGSTEWDTWRKDSGDCSEIGCSKGDVGMLNKAGVLQSDTALDNGCAGCCSWAKVEQEVDWTSELPEGSCAVTLKVDCDAVFRRLSAKKLSSVKRHLLLRSIGHIGWRTMWSRIIQHSGGLYVASWLVFPCSGSGSGSGFVIGILPLWYPADGEKACNFTIYWT